MQGSELALLATIFGVLFTAVYYVSLRSGGPRETLVASGENRASL